MAKTRPIRLKDGRVVRLTRGEVTAIKRYVKLWGTQADAVLYDPGHVRYDTRFNLVAKGLLRLENGITYWAEGVWA
jgi:cell division septal protein FtsQ